MHRNREKVIITVKNGIVELYKRSDNVEVNILNFDTNPDGLIPDIFGDKFAVGDKVRAINDLEAFPDFIIEKGVTGIVTGKPDKTNENYEIKLDKHFDALNVWDNKILAGMDGHEMAIMSRDFELIENSVAEKM